MTNTECIDLALAFLRAVLRRRSAAQLAALDAKLAPTIAKGIVARPNRAVLAELPVIKGPGVTAWRAALGACVRLVELQCRRPRTMPPRPAFGPDAPLGAAQIVSAAMRQRGTEISVDALQELAHVYGGAGFSLWVNRDRIERQLKQSRPRRPLDLDRVLDLALLNIASQLRNNWRDAQRQVPEETESALHDSAA